jgi:sigma-E factor negative regulatory protein RseA
MNIPTQPPSSDAALVARRQALSDLMDGVSDAGGAAAACDAWRLDARSRQDWHAYQVIGDVLRTPELAPRGAVADAAFLAALRARLAQEPVVIAPAATAPTTIAPSVLAQPLKRRVGWRNTMAVAAGFAAVAVVVNGLPWGAEPAAGPDLASASKAVAPAATAVAPPAVLSAARSPAAAPLILVNDQRMVRDAQLDRYLSAHRQFGGAPAMALPGGVIRSVSATAPER